jgi:hypothetical protein
VALAAYAGNTPLYDHTGIEGKQEP